MGAPGLDPAKVDRLLARVRREVDAGLQAITPPGKPVDRVSR